MAGHSKWANIKFKKASQDKKRGKLFTKLIREITVAAKESGGDPQHNPRLRTAIDKALDNNMTRDNIDRAISRGAGTDESDQLEEVRYEGYGPGGVAVMILCLTDNRNRTVSDVRHCLVKHGGNLGTDGSVAFLFKHIGQIIFSPDNNEDKILEIALNSGAQDVITHTDGSFEVQTEPRPEVLEKIVAEFKKNKLIPEAAEIVYNAETTVELDGEAEEKYLKMMDKLEDLDDVQDVYTNA